MDSKKSGIYWIRNKVNEKFCIGSTNCFSRRYNEHFYSLRKNEHYNTLLQKAFNKYGEENLVFEIIEECTEEILLEREQYYLNSLLFAQEYILYNDKRFSELGYNIEPIAGKRFNTTIPVAKVGLEGEILKIYSSIKEAAIDLGGEDSYYRLNSSSVNDSGIGAVIRGNQLTAKGFIWILYDDDRGRMKEDIEIRLSKFSPIERLDLKSGERLKLYRGVGEIEKELGITIGNSNLREIRNIPEKVYRGEFYRNTSFATKTYYASCDPGKSGAICFMSQDGQQIFTSKIPLLGDEIDTVRLSNLLRSWRKYIKVFITEDVHSIFGTSAKSNFQFGRSLGIIEGIIAGLDVTHIKVTPKTWQKLAFLGIPEQRKASVTKGKPGPIDTKAMALIAASRLYPSVELTATERSKKPHDGIVDALLLSHYARLTQL